MLSFLIFFILLSPILLSIAPSGEYEPFHTDHLNDPTDVFPNDYMPMVIPFNEKNIMIAPLITDTIRENDTFKPFHHPCKSAQTIFVDNDWSDKDANYTYLFEDWTDYDWNDIVVSLYAVTNNVIEVEIRLVDREAGWKNPFDVEITPGGLTVDVHWNSTDYPGDHVVKVNPGETVDIELLTESNPGDTAFITIIPLIPPVASFVYSPLYPQVSEDVTFNASASTPDGGYIVSYEWDFGDDSPREFGMVVTHHYTATGTYNVTLNVTDSEGKWDTESKIITVTPRTYTLTITSTTGGTTNPVPDSYSYEEGTIVSVTAVPDSGYIFGHWKLDGVNVGSVSPISVTMDKDHTLHAVFKTPSKPVGGHIVPIDKSHLLAQKIGLAQWIGLAFTFLVAVAVIIILIRRRNKHFSGNLEGSVA
ncbi:MAG: PKD domain-containing protein [Candidatus Bathyarchaeia archaeon]